MKPLKNVLMALTPFVVVYFVFSLIACDEEQALGFENVRLVGPETVVLGEEVSLLCTFTTGLSESGREYKWMITPPDNNEIVEVRNDARKNPNSSNQFSVEYTFIPQSTGIYLVEIELQNLRNSDRNEVRSTSFEVIPDPDNIPVSIPCEDIPTCAEGQFFEVNAGCRNRSEAIPDENLIQTPSFEDITVEDRKNSEFNSVIPDESGQWRANNVEEVGADITHNISPVEGNTMLRFAGSGLGGTPASNLFQSVVIPGDRLDQLANGDSLAVTFSAYVNRVMGNESTDTEFVLQLIAYPGEPASWADQFFDETVDEPEVIEVLVSDACVNSWERIALVFPRLPANTTFLGARVIARENVIDDPEGEVEFDGHYLDAVSLVISD